MNILKKITVDCERMKYPHTGLYNYCYHLGKALIASNKIEQKLCFYTPPSLSKIFGSDQCYIHQRQYHKVVFPSSPNIDLWHSTHQSTDYFPYREKLKLVLTIHDLNYLYDIDKTETKKKRYLDALKKKIERADHIVTISSFTLQDVQKHFDVENKPCSVIYNGCNIEEAGILSTPVNAPHNPFLFTIGTLADKKNFHVLPALLQKNDMWLIIAGITQSESYKQKIIETAKQLSVRERVVFTGPVSENDKQWYMKHCRAFVFPSISEGFGLPVVEAMYFGKPVLLSRHTSLPEIGGSAAYYFKNFDDKEMQKTLEESLHDFEINKRSESIKERALLFNWNKTAEQYHAVYKSLLD